MRTVDRRLRRKFRFTLAILPLAVLSPSSPAYAAEDEEIAQLITPESAVTAGAAAVSGDPRDRSLFGQYNGLRKDDFYLMLDFAYVKRDDATGTWTVVEGRNLGLETRELRAMLDRQGSWKIYGEYSELVRYYPRTINTSLQGAETTTPTVTRLAVPGTGSDLDLKTERKKATLGGEKWITPRLMVEAVFTNEDKSGARLFGRGFNCPSAAAPTPVCTALASGANQWALLMLPEPIDSTTRQIEAKVNFIGERFAINAGYYGSFYDNGNGALTPTVVGNLNNPLGSPMGTPTGVALTAGLRNILQQPMALPPDNQAHQFSVSGNYAIAPTTRANFKFAYTHATQNDDFASNGLTGAPAGISNYGGVLNTTLAQAGLTSRPVSKLTLTANLRYEDREDKSPLALYNIEGANRFTNGTYSLKKTAGKLEGSYQLPAGLRATLGADYEAMDRGQYSSPECIELAEDCIGDSIAGISALRAKTWETSYRAELRRSMSDTLSASLSYVRSDRNGSSWLKPNALPDTGTTALSDEEIFNRTGIFPMIFMDRKRDKVRAMADWSPMDRLSLQATAEYGKDKYSGPTTKGLQDTGMKLFGVDVSYAVSDNWKVTGYYTYSEQTLHVSHSTGYIADLEDRNSALGLSLAGKPAPKLRVGVDLQYINDRNIYAQGLDSAASAANQAFLAQSGGLPDVTFRNYRLKLFGKYALQKNADLRVEVVHDRSQLNEWTWGNNGVPFLYSDNTTVSINPDQRVTYVSVVYTYRWR
jgi:MtrB/PioB family decaheme-associated outer membrane protein